MDLYIIGAGNVGGFLAYHINDFEDFHIKGFLDSDPDKINQTIYGVKVIGNEDILNQINKKTAVAIAIANPKVKKKVYDLISNNPHLIFPNFIHPRAWISSNVVYGEGNIIYPGVSINFECEIGNFCTINMNSALGHNCQLHDFVSVSPGVNLGGFTIVEEGAFLGIGASTIQNICIERYSTVGGMSMVTKNVQEGKTVVGNPARVVPGK